MSKRNNNLVVMYHGDDWNVKIPFKKSSQREAYEHWSRISHEEGIKYHKASIEWYDTSKNIFKKAWTFENEKWIKLRNVKPAYVYDKVSSKYDIVLNNKKEAINSRYPLLNNPEFRLFLGNKLNQYLLFYRHMPKTIMVMSKNDLKNRIKEIKSNKLVVKPFYGSGGFGIKIINKKDIKKTRFPMAPYLLQEFITGRGFKNNSKKLADLRIVFLNHKYVYACSRIAREGSLFTNFHQGAKMEIINKNEIPKNVFRAIKDIQDQLSIFKHCDYSLDFLFDKNLKPWLMEMNTTPGIDYFSTENQKYRKKYLIQVMKTLKDIKNDVFTK